MSELFDQFGLGLLNFVIGFGAGWLCRRAAKPSAADTASENPDIAGMLNVVDELEEAASDQEKSNRVLRTIIGGEPVEFGQILGVHLQSNRQYGRLLKTYHEKLEHYDPDNTFVPAKFTEGIEQNLQAVCLLTDQLESAEEFPHHSLNEILDRLTRLEQSNAALQSEIDLAKRTISDQAMRLTAVETAAFEDFLTKLPNRRAFEHRFSELSEALHSGGPTFCMLLIDIDRFKNVNDTHGHECGDAVLSVIAHVLQDVSRGQDHVSRHGGEEFAVLATETELEGARTLAERIRKRVEATATRYADVNVRITCSIGIAQADTPDAAAQLFEFADAALYTAKESGRNRVEVHERAPEPSFA